MFKDYYQILEVPRDASQPEIKKSYRKLAKTHHPDSNLNLGDADQFLLINEAYQILSDSVSRESYNVRYDQIFQIRKKYTKQPTASVFSEAYTETYQEPYTAPDTAPEESYSEPYNYPPEPEFEQETRYQEPDYQAYGATQAKPKSVGIEKFYGLKWLAMTISALCLLFAMSLMVDYFQAEASEVQTMIEARLTTDAQDNISCTIMTDKSEFPVDYQKYGLIGKGDELIVYTTPYYKIMSSIQIVNGESFWPHSGIYNTFSVFIFLLLGSSLLGLFLRNPAYILRLGIANIILAMLTALILLRS